MEDETKFLILQGCKLARDLESNLPTVANQPQIRVSETCEVIIRIFTSALEKLMNNMNSEESTEGYQSCFPRLLPDNNWGSGKKVGSDHQVRAKLLLKAEMGQGSSDGEGCATFRGLGGGILSMEVSSDLNRTASSSQRSRRSVYFRRDEGEKRVMRVAAPQMGNTDIPPDDGHTWRKYGQKAILGSTNPRSYYRCTHQKLYQCPAKKQVQRLDDDPRLFEVIYHHDHTCHMSPTAPLFPPQPPSANVIPMDLDLCRFSGSSSTIPVVGGSGSGTSAARHNKEVVEYPVADMATAMFNPGTNNPSTIDMIFRNSKEGK
ncbi:WRKY transcription factor 55-like isoform X1 [Syzygium oleosum]|uniref:WRKY transcription factor 55-like isoform X1 n=1 Tax=Syzygium oleosum TaxID=219896 RepID=UPI0011D270A4|nr:WRKY transcription factor 55-like isoform X1 [Syzygium oleosum]